MATPRIPREKWRSHPRFRTQATLLDSHHAFRGHSQWIIERLRHLAPRGARDARRRNRWVKRMRDDFFFWLSGMHGHERYEERKLFPYLARRYGISYHDLTADHRELDACEARARRAFTDALHDDGQARSLLSMLPLAQLIQELESHRRLLLEHLEREEERVIPLLLDLTRREYRRMQRTPIDKLV